jgi:hypothetical protein
MDLRIPSPIPRNSRTAALLISGEQTMTPVSRSSGQYQLTDLTTDRVIASVIKLHHDFPLSEKKEFDFFNLPSESNRSSK